MGNSAHWAALAMLFAAMFGWQNFCKREGKREDESGFTKDAKMEVAATLAVGLKGATAVAVVGAPFFVG